MSRSNARWAVVLTLIVVLVFAVAGGAIAKKGGVPGPPTDPGGGGGGGHTETATNNLSFPAIAADNFSISGPVTELLTVPYTGDNTGLTQEELDALDGFSWYAQKVDGNKWQALFELAGNAPVDVYGVDWGDNVESVSPTVRNPYRLELVLYDEAADWPATSEPNNAYTMALLANPSSPDEVQGTNGVPYNSTYATVVSLKPKLVIQDITNYLDPEDPPLTWDGTRWISGTAVPGPTSPAFGPELNVAGKYIFGGSQGGWKPATAGVYRVTFYLPDSSISLANAGLGNLVGGVWNWIDEPPITAAEADDGDPVATPVLMRDENLTYVDLTVEPRTGGKPQ
jgi:hypothetical protein